MEKKHKIIQIYAVIISVIAVTTIIFSLGDLVSSYIDRQDPLHTNWADEKLSSFENYKMSTLKSISKEQMYIPDDATILKMYNDAKEDKINQVLHQANRSIIVDSLLIVVCVILAGSHWWLMKKYKD